MRGVGAGMWGFVLLAAGCTADLPQVTPHQRAFAALSATDWVMAEQLYGDILRTAPDDPFALYNLGVVYLRTQRSQLARPLFQRVIDLNPPDIVVQTTNGSGKGSTLVDLARLNLRTIDAP